MHLGRHSLGLFSSLLLSCVGARINEYFYKPVKIVFIQSPGVGVGPLRPLGGMTLLPPWLLLYCHFIIVYLSYEHHSIGS